MRPITAELVAKAAEVLASKGSSDKEVEAQINDFTSDSVLTARLLNFIPEAFAFAFVPHLPDGRTVVMPKNFSVRSLTGDWTLIPLSSEPIFVLAVRLGMHLFHEGPREDFKTVVSRSALLNCVDNLLNSGQSLAGANMAGLAINGVFAEDYAEQPNPRSR